MLNLDFVTLIVFYGAIQGIILAVALNRLPDRATPANRTLTILVLLVSTVLLSRLVYVDGSEIWRNYPHLFLLPDLPMFFYGPLLFFYFSHRLKEDSQRLRLSWLHFVPAAVHVLILSSYLLESSDDYSQRLISGDFWEYPWVNIVALFHLAVYWSLSVGCLKEYERREATRLFPTAHLWVFLGVILLSVMGWSYFYLATMLPGLPALSPMTDQLIWTLLSLNTAIPAVFAMVRPDFFKDLFSREKYHGARLSEAEVEQYAQRLETTMREQQPYLKSDLTLADLADLLSLPPKSLSQVINRYFQMNFSDYINGYRIAAFKALVSANKLENQTILALALSAGFNSKTTFNTAFRKATGQSPAEFLKQKQA